MSVYSSEPNVESFKEVAIDPFEEGLGELLYWPWYFSLSSVDQVVCSGRRFWLRFENLFRFENWTRCYNFYWSDCFQLCVHHLYIHTHTTLQWYFCKLSFFWPLWSLKHHSWLSMYKMPLAEGTTPNLSLWWYNPLVFGGSALPPSSYYFETISSFPLLSASSMTASPPSALTWPDYEKP